MAIGGVTKDVSAIELSEIVDVLDGIEKDFAELESIIFANASLTDRLETTGVLTERTGWDHGVVGVVGRASGIDQDVRRDRPFAAYDEVPVKISLYRYGDVRARLRVRMDEIHESIRADSRVSGEHFTRSGRRRGGSQATTGPMGALSRRGLTWRNSLFRHDRRAGFHPSV